MSNHQRLDDGMRWRIVGRLEAGQSQVQICREFNLTPSVVCNLWKQFQDTGSIQRKPGGGVDPEFILMDDNERPHRALLVDEFLESEDIRRMDWPARSPDLNPIEHVWEALERAIATRNLPPRTIQEMKTALLNEWDQLPQ
ncbi:hypothetical protein AVEN_224414-1, partial [Araneus ventricosus]